jgi:hypothetical protein
MPRVCLAVWIIGLALPGVEIVFRLIPGSVASWSGLEFPLVVVFLVSALSSLAAVLASRLGRRDMDVWVLRTLSVLGCWVLVTVFAGALWLFTHGLRGTQ